MYFDSGMGHAYIAVGLKRCRVLSICTATQSQLIEALGVEQSKPTATRKRTLEQPVEKKQPVATKKKRRSVRAT